MLEKTKLKRIAIIIIYIILFIAIGFAIYFIRKPAATCNDQILNQGEKEIDCGGPCSPCKNISQANNLIVQEIAFVNGGNNTYDVVAKISNPNDSVGAKQFTYTFTLKDDAGTIISTRTGSSFILPGDFRYITELGLSTDASIVPASASLEMSNLQWEKLSGIGKPQIGVYNKTYGEAEGSIGSEAQGTIRNENGYDIGSVEIVVVLRDEKGKIIGTNKTQKDSIRVKEDRGFLLTWPYELGGNVQKIDVDPQANVFDTQNFSIQN